MASNSFGTIFKIITWGESHGKAIGVVIDGCPAGLHINEEIINEALKKRQPGHSIYTSERKESDSVEILSGVWDGVTTGAPISLLMANHGHNSQDYAGLENMLRPGHANYTYLEKYGVFDYRGGGRASARETACRVAAGAIAKELLKHYNIELCAYLSQVGSIFATNKEAVIKTLLKEVNASQVYCPDKEAAKKIETCLLEVKEAKDSIGGAVSFMTSELPVGLGDPVYEKIEAKLAHAMLSIPASKGFEVGQGFNACHCLGSHHNDPFTVENSNVKTTTNLAGGTLGGITNGMPIYGRVAFKPASSIKLPQKTVTRDHEEAVFQIPEKGRHDPCVAIRAVPVVEAMLALTLADTILMQRVSKL